MCGPERRSRSDEWPTIVKPFCKSKKRYRKLLEKHVAALSALQNLHYASGRYALLLIFQGMDAAGKDGAIRHVMSGVNPRGLRGFQFQTAERRGTEARFSLAHDLPPAGTRADRHLQSFLLRGGARRSRASGDSPGQGLPQELLDEKDLWKERYRSIVDLEEHLYRNGTRIIKVFLHLSKDEQRKRFLERIDEPDKNWKFSLADIHERKFWKHYMKAFEACLNATSTRHAPWYVVPADDKENARLIVSQIVLDALDDLKMAYPKTTAERRRELKSIRKQL